MEDTDKEWQAVVQQYPKALRNYDDEFGPVGKGWYPLVAKAAKVLEPHGGYFVQIKEKFGTLRLYYTVDGRIPDEVDDVVNQMENLSASFCELCGMHGQLRSGGWLLTLCDKCHTANEVRKAARNA